MAISAIEDKPELDKYELAEQIGHGGMATVYRASDRRLGREVAVKLIHPHLRSNTEVAARFVSEARAVAKLKHPNIVEVYDISDEGEAERYLVVELIDGPTLRELLTERGRLPPEIAASLGIQLAAALAHAHEQSIIHRDVKPENVLIRPPTRPSQPDSEGSSRATVKLTDFGIAKLLDAHGVTSTGQVLGSPAHMAPEQIEGGPVGPPADVFGLGVLLFESMVGSLPFDGSNPAQVLRKVLDGEHAAAVKLRPEVGSVYSDLLDRALSTRAEDRFDSVEEMAAALRNHLALLGIESPNDELTAYLLDPDGYERDFPARIASALGDAGQRARAAGDVAAASRFFNRALAYRPGDPELLSRVSSVARGQALSRTLKWAAATGGVFAVAGAAWYYWPAAELDVSPPLRVAPAPAQTPRLPPIGLGAKPLPSPRSSAPVQSSGEPSASAAPAAPAAERPVVRRRPPTVGQHITPREPRPVRIIVRGAKGGQLLIDGTPKPDWLQDPVTDLVPGPHTFEFQLKDPQCCKAPRVTRTIAPGQGEEVVTLEVKYRNALLDVRGPKGELSCPTLFSGPVHVPGRRSVEMINSLEEREPCTYTPANPNSSRLSSPSVTLRAGITTQLTVP